MVEDTKKFPDSKGERRLLEAENHPVLSKPPCGNISPHLYVFFTLIAALSSFYLFKVYRIKDTYFFLPFLILALIYAAVNLLRQYRGQSVFALKDYVEFKVLFKKAFARYLVWLTVIFLASRLYQFLPFYNTMKSNLVFFSYFLKFYLIFGLPYHLITLVVKSSVTEDFYDPAVRLIHIFKQVSSRILRGDFTSVFFVFNNKYNRKVLLCLVMRAYFIPIMVIQVYSNLGNSIRYSAGGFNGFDIFTIFMWVAAILWLMDTVNVSLAYGFESRWVENRSRSIDMTFSGWLVCLMCYAPLNNITGAVFPFGPLAGMYNPESLLLTRGFSIYALKILEIAILVGHIYADVSLGPSVANITLKKLQTRGLYGIIRHPGTTFKLLLWWIQSVFYGEFWKVGYILGHLAWNAIYVLRALTEERHLNQHEEYREYKKKVRYRFIPGIF